MNIVQTRNINDDHLLHDESNVERASTSNFTIHVTATSRLVPNQVDARIYNDVLHQEEIEPPENFEQNQGKKRKYVKRKRFVTIHECEYCGKVLQYPSKIAEHMRTHNGDRPFTCSICHASFTQAAPLKAHLRSHSNIKPYECKYCHKGFTTSSNRASHEKSCHDGVTYSAPTTRKRGKRVVSQNFCHDEEQEYEPGDFPDYNDSMLDSPNKIMVSTVEELIENVDDPNNVIDDASIVIEDMNAHVYSNDAEENIAYYVAVNNDPNEQFPISPQPLKFFKRADGSLLVGDQVLFPETLPDGQVVYNYAGSEENLHFILEDSNPILEYNVHEMDHPSEEMNELIEVPQNEVIIYEGEEHVEEGIPEEIFEDPEIIEEEYLTYEHQEYCQSEQQFLNIEVEHEMPGTSLMPEVPVLADPRPPRKGRPRYFKSAQQESPHFLEVPVEVFEMAAPKQLRRPKNERYQSLPDVRPARNLNWVIDAVAKNLPLEEVSPHVRKRAQVYTCEICGQIIKYPSKIEAHKRTHTGERPFPCEICGMSFTQRTTLRMHLRRHLNHKPFCCNIDGCTKSFISGALLNEHIQKRHAGHRFACLRNCGRIFRTNRERQKHEQTCVGVAIAEHINLLIEEPIIDGTVLDEIVDLSIDTNHVIYH